MSAAGAGLRAEGGPDAKKRGLAAVLVLLAVIAVAILLFRGDGGYRVTAEFVNAGQLVKGNEVKAGGVTVGRVKDIDVSQDGAAEVTLAITDSDYEPLRQGTRVLIKQASLSGIANRYVDLQLGPANGDEIEDGEFCVALRCALLRGPVAHLYAGCGIVRDSVAAEELAETEVKLQALLPLLS
jgi:ABC-type transporter Mla subunit MlaD